MLSYLIKIKKLGFILILKATSKVSNIFKNQALKDICHTHTLPKVKGKTTDDPPPNLITYKNWVKKLKKQRFLLHPVVQLYLSFFSLYKNINIAYLYCVKNKCLFAYILYMIILITNDHKVFLSFLEIYINTSSIHSWRGR